MPDLEPHPIYKMNLHERYNVDEQIDMLRVPGGWVYVPTIDTNEIMTADSISVFVPTDNEFQYENND